MEELPGVLFTLATCEARAGRVASASAHYRDFLSYVSHLSPEQRLAQAERERVAREEWRALRSRIPHLELRFSTTLPDGARVRLDGTELAPSLLHERLPIDPGEHVVVLSIPGRSSLERKFSIEPAEKLQLELDVPPERSIETTPSAERSSSSRAFVPWMIVSGAVGGAGIATGTVAGIFALDRKSVVDDHCEGAECDATGKAAADSGKTAALVSTIGFGVGLGGLAALLVLELARPDDETPASTISTSERTRLSFTENGVAWGGVF